MTIAPTDVEFERIWLDDESWVDCGRGWLQGADELYAELVEKVPWEQSKLWRYERWIAEPRLGYGYGRGKLPHPALVDAQRQLQTRYKVEFDGTGMAYYRDGHDGQAFHRDRDMRYCEDTVIAVLTLGARRPWLLRRRTRRDKWIADHGGAEYDLAPAGGDVHVMGGRCQINWEHSVPQVRGVPNAGRISAQWRWTSGRGRPELGGSYRAPRNFSRR